MAFSPNGMTPGCVQNNNVSEFEEILNLQRQGRRLSDMQLRSLDAYCQRRLATGSNVETVGHFSHPLPAQLPPQQSGMSMPFQSHPLQQYPGLIGESSMSGYGSSEQFGGNQSLHPAERRRSSMGLMSSFINEMGGYNGNSSKPDGMPNMEHQRSNPMARRTSLDLLGDAAMAVSNQEQNSITDQAASLMGRRSSMDLLIGGDPQKRRTSLDFFMNSDHRRASLDALVNNDGSLGRRNSLAQLFAQDFPPSRRSSMAGAGMGGFGNPIDPYYMENLFEADQAKLAAAGLGRSNAHNAPGQGADMITLQLLQQQQDEENTLSNVEDYIKLQKLQSTLRRQSLSQMYDEMSMVFQMQNGNPLGSQETDRPQASQLQMEQLYQQQQQEKQQQILQQRQLNSDKSNPPPTKPDPEPEDEEFFPPCSTDQIDSFQKSMDTSAKSQKDIQLWDKKMGLKRSHSATMTKTTRSRKNLRRILDKHLAILKEQNETSATDNSDDTQDTPTEELPVEETDDQQTASERVKVESREGQEKKD